MLQNGLWKHNRATETQERFGGICSEKSLGRSGASIVRNEDFGLSSGSQYKFWAVSGATDASEATQGKQGAPSGSADRLRCEDQHNRYALCVEQTAAIVTNVSSNILYL